MIEARRRAYLDALGLDVWVARPQPVERGWLGVDAGHGSTLLVCASSAERETQAAADVTRALGGDPVWGWPDAGPDEGGERLETLVADRLITRILLLGPRAGRSLFAGDVPATVGSATVTVAPALEALAASATARRTFWRMLRDGPA